MSAGPRRFPAALATLAAFVVAAVALAFAARAEAYIWWADWGGGGATTIGRANVDGSGVNQSFIRGADAPCGVAVNDKYVFWGNERTGTIGRANLDGSGVNQSFIRGADSPCGVAVNDEYVYWANGGPGGNGTTIGRGTVDGSRVNQSFITGLRNPCGMAIDDEHIYWASNAGLGRANLDGSGVNQSFTPSAAVTCGVAVDDKNIYWAAALGLYRTPLVDPNREFFPLVQDDNAGAVCGVAVDDPYVYWANSEANPLGTTIGRVTTTGHELNSFFIMGATRPCGVAVDALPSRQFRLGRVKRQAGKGTATLPVKVPGPGKVKLKRTKKVKPASKRATGAATLKHRIKPRGKARKGLRDGGRVQVRARVTYSPDGGEPRTKTKKLKLRLKEG